MAGSLNSMAGSLIRKQEEAWKQFTLLQQPAQDARPIRCDETLRIENPANGDSHPRGTSGREASPPRRRVAELQRPQEVLDVERAVNCLRDMGSLWADSPRRQQREFVREVFERMVLEGPELASITPKPLYAPLFVLDRRERFSGDFCSLAPRAGFEPTT